LDGSLWIAKFPAREDDRDVGAWEYVTHQMARQVGIDVPEARLIRLNNDFHTHCTQRFDRAVGKRRFYASAMTLLRKEQSEGSSYLEIAQFLRTQGDGEHTAKDLAQLFRRVAFNVAVGNRDDHLRNHGFILGATGWRLSPAFDVNPNIDKSEHVLNIDAIDNRPDLNTLLSTAEFYGLTPAQAKQTLDNVLTVTGTWRETARQVGLAKADIELTASAFAAS
jgi:serine/threonine-protein kinase HipA